MKVKCTSEEQMLAGDYSDVPGVIVTCSRCGETAEVFGTERPSIKRACVMLSQQCKSGARNFYVVPSGF